jgi:hypothetical protein
MNNYIEEIILILNDKYSYEHIDENSIMIKNVTKYIREKLHHYAEKNNLHSKSFVIECPGHIKNMIISSTPIVAQINMDDFNAYFVRFYKYPIDITHPKYINYFIDELIYLYPDIKNNYDEMLEIYINKFNNDMGIFRNYINIIKKKMMDNITNNEGYARFIASKPTLRTISSNICSNVFIQKNINKQIVRFDIIKANYNIMKLFDYSIFNSNCWEEYISKFTDIDFFKKSKILREVFFGELKTTKKVSSFYSDILLSIYEKFAMYNPLCIHGDAICFEYNEEQSNEIFTFINSKYSNIFRMEIFNLTSYETKIGTIYIESHINTNKTKICGCPRKYIIQAAKFHQKKKITDIDKKFMDNGMIATFDESIFYE